MMKILIPVDDSDSSLRAVEHLITIAGRCRETLDVHLLNIQPSLHGEVGRFLSHEQIRDFHRDNGLKEMAAAREKFDAAGIQYQFHISVGDPAEVIAEYAQDRHFDQIIMGTHARGPIASFLLGSVATQVIHLTGIPVLLVK